MLTLCKVPASRVWSPVRTEWIKSHTVMSPGLHHLLLMEATSPTPRFLSQTDVFLSAADGSNVVRGIFLQPGLCETHQTTLMDVPLFPQLVIHLQSHIAHDIRRKIRLESPPLVSVVWTQLVFMVVLFLLRSSVCPDDVCGEVRCVVIVASLASFSVISWSLV